jgi:hypothetical protein
MVLTQHGNEHVGFELHQQDVLDVIKEPVCSYCDMCEKIKDLVHMYQTYMLTPKIFLDRRKDLQNHFYEKVAHKNKNSVESTKPIFRSLLQNQIV